jgi:hypothetical protein
MPVTSTTVAQFPAIAAATAQAKTKDLFVMSFSFQIML